MGTTETKPTTADLERLISEITPGPWKAEARAALTQPTGEPK
ncbi:hypothetical protein [uncultured Paracoccus sp.]|nr:hypothetical protein [uncultured Paracoccus sp.]